MYFVICFAFGRDCLLTKDLVVCAPVFSMSVAMKRTQQIAMNFV